MIKTFAPIVRSLVILAIGLPVGLGLSEAVRPADAEPKTAVEQLKADLELPCVKFVITKADSKGERAAKDNIEEMIGDGVDFVETCRWVLK